MATKRNIAVIFAVTFSLVFMMVSYHASANGLYDGLSDLNIINSEDQRDKPRYIFVDLGANRGDSLETFLQNEEAQFQYDYPCPEWATHNQAEIYLFEANPYFNAALVNAKEQYTAQDITINIFPSTVVDIVDGTRTFYLDTVNKNQSFWGSSTYANHPDAVTSKSNGTELTAINISRWLLMNTLPRDFVVVKMDIEAAEYQVIPHMVEMSAWTVIDHLLVEWHESIPEASAIERVKEATEVLKSKGVNLPDYDSST